MSHDHGTAVKPIDGATASTSDGQPVPERKPRLDLSIPQLLAGALAAASAAVAASWLGVAGTVLGAVVASLVVSVSSALYKHSLERSSQVIRETLPVLPERSRGADGASTAERLPPARAGRSRGATSARASRRVRWGVVAVSAVVTLVVGLGMLTALETVLGRSVSSLTGSDGDGRTTVGRLISHGSNTGSDTGTKPADPASPGPSGSGPSTGTTTSPPATQPPTTQPPTTTEQPTTAPQTSAEPTPTAPVPSVSGQPPAAGNTAPVS